MLSFFTVVAGLIVLAALCIVLGLGLALVLGLILFFAIIAALIGLLFGGGSMLSIMSGLKQGSDIPQHFNTCLLEKQPESCRAEWTVWDAKELATVQAIARQVQSDLGERIDDSSSSQSYNQETKNGSTVLTLDLITDFAKKKAVREHYVLVEVKNKMKIKELKWDY
ncbi:MAG: hypothetical protein NTX25_05220 [Proteobacteria bacterium]|nr:hypothetical protein [Pseudomonadota bacterium]